MILKNLTIDLWEKPYGVINVVQYEASGRTLAVRLTSGGVAVNLTDCSINFYAKKPSGAIVYNSCTIINPLTGQIEYTITEQTVPELGNLTCFFTIDKAGSSLRSQEFTIVVNESEDVSSAAESTSEFTALSGALVLVTDTQSGWTSTTDTWVYASATTITVPSGAASRYQKGDKIKFTQTTVKYFYVVDVADTLLTVTGGSDFTVANAAISAIYYSKIANPQGFPHWFNWAPTLGGYSANPTNAVYRFRINGNSCDVELRESTSGTSNANTTTISAPVTAKTLTNAGWRGIAAILDNNTLQPNFGCLWIGSGESVITVYKDMASTTLWTASGNKRCPGASLRYEI